MTDYAGDLRRLCDKCVHLKPLRDMTLTEYLMCEVCDGQEYFEAEEDRTMNKRICGTCRWHQHEDISDGWVCVNDQSDHRADWTGHDDLRRVGGKER